MHCSRRQILFSWCLYDWANSAFATVILAAVLPVYFVSLVPAGGAVLPWTGRSYSAATLWGYTVSLSMLGLALCAPVLGAWADKKARHKSLMTWFCLAGGSATAGLALTGQGDYLAAALLFAVGNIGFAGANIFYNAYLPLLADPGETDRLSARGYAFGYVGGGLLLALAFLLIINHSACGFADRAAATRFAFLLTSCWWLFFALPAFICLPRTADSRTQGLRLDLKSYLGQFRQLGRYRDLSLFLLAFLCYNDGIQTIISVSAVYAREELQLSQGTIIGCFLMIQFAAMPGALLFSRIADKLGTARAIQLSLAVFTAVCFFAYRLQGEGDCWALGAVIALVLGGSQALSRSLYASLVPKHKSAEFFGFFFHQLALCRDFRPPALCPDRGFQRQFASLDPGHCAVFLSSVAVCY